MKRNLFCIQLKIKQKKLNVSVLDRSFNMTYLYGSTA